VISYITPANTAVKYTSQLMLIPKAAIAQLVQ